MINNLFPDYLGSIQFIKFTSMTLTYQIIMHSWYVSTCFAYNFTVHTRINWEADLTSRPECHTSIQDVMPGLPKKISLINICGPLEVWSSIHLDNLTFLGDKWFFHQHILTLFLCFRSLILFQWTKIVFKVILARYYFYPNIRVI